MKGTRTCVAVTCLAVLLVYSNSPILAQENTSSKKATLANHEPSAGSNAAQDFMKAQAPLLSAAERIQSLDSQGTGLGGIRLKVDKHLLEVWWKGEPPSAVRKEIAQLEKSKDIKISLGSAQYTRKELLETARTIVSRANEYPGLVSLGPLPDGSGLEVGHPDTERAATFRFPVPVHIVMRKGAVPLFSRGHDTPPWWAGAVTRSAVQNPTTCSTGFAMARGANHGILTAEHCFCGGGVLFNNGVGVTIGLAEPASLQAIGRTDSLYIDANSGPETYDGGVGVGEFSKPVVGSSSNFAGMGVCTSGAATGVHCNIFIDITGVTFTSTCPGEQFVTGISIAGQADGGVAAGAGDSGGPAFTLTGPDNSQVQAAGIISVGWDEVPCQTFGSVCFNMIGFTDIDTLKAAHGANVLVLPAASGGGVSTISIFSFAGLNLLWMLLALSRKLKNGQVQAR